MTGKSGRILANGVEHYLSTFGVTSSGSYLGMPSTVRAVPRVFSGVSEHCQGKSGNITCQHSHVILMTSARYGRMHTGLGCFSDALAEVDLLCSGRKRCSCTLLI